MDYSKYTLNNGTEIYVVQSPLWTHTSLSMKFYSRNGHENAARALGTAMLNEGTKDHSSSQAIEAEAEKHFGAHIGVASGKNADLQIAIAGIDVLTRQELTDGENTLEAMMSLMSEMLYRPFITAGEFNRDYFRVKQKEIAVSVKRAEMNKEAEAKQRFIEVAFGAGSPFAARTAGRSGDIEKISNMEAVWVWQRTYETASRRIFAATNLSPEYIAQVCALHFNNLPNVCSDIRTGAVPEKNAVKVEEESAFDQTMVYMGFPVAMPDTPKERIALGLLNTYFGGYGGGRIETEIRAKRDMAYYARSALDRNTGLLYGFTGVDISNKDIALAIMAEEMEKVRKGKITKRGFEQAKRMIVEYRKINAHTKETKLDALETFVLTGRPDGMDSGELLESVSYEDAIGVSARIIDAPVTYCLLGGKK